jgi:hypothetical protein
MSSTIRTRATVLRGRRLDIPTPQLREGETVDVIVVVPEDQPGSRGGVLDFLDALPPGPRSAGNWDEVERGLKQERDSWEH